MLAYLRGSPDLLRLLGAMPMEPGLYGRPHGRVGIACLPRRTTMHNPSGLMDKMVEMLTSNGKSVEVTGTGGVAMFWPLAEGAESD